MLIGSLSRLSYVDFLVHLAPVAAVGLCVNWALAHWIHLRGAVDQVDVDRALDAPEFQPGRIRRKPIVVLLIVLGAFLAGVPPAMAAAVGAALLLVTRSVEPRRVYDEVDWGLLVFFVGLFIIVAGAERAGLTSTLFAPLAALNLRGLPVFAAVTAALSNVVSNVPAVMLLRTAIPAFPNPHTGWLALAMSSTLAGNLTITGSIANIIVVERAAAEGVAIGFWDYLRVGVPVTAATLVIGTLWLALTHY
jgi:Na+/H+ antiporter NhaD/arsenite permease-like protein